MKLALSREDCVDAGAAYLDSWDIEWWRQIDDTTLNIADNRLCVAGQLSDFDTGWGWIAAHCQADGPTMWAVAHGFADAFPPDLGGYPILGELWKRKVHERRLAASVPV